MNTSKLCTCVRSTLPSVSGGPLAPGGLLASCSSGGSGHGAARATAGEGHR